MRVLLVNPYNVGWSGLQNILQLEPLGLELIATNLLANHDIYILDLRYEPDLEGFLASWKPDIVGVSCLYTSHIGATWDIAQRIKRVSQRITVFTGGNPPTLAPEYFNSPDIDYIVRGDGELTIADLCRGIEGKMDFRDIPGLVVNSSGAQSMTKDRLLPSDFTGTPIPNRNLPGINRRNYYLGLQREIANYELTRGCKFRCNFCAIWKFADGTVRSRTVEDAVAELARIKEERIFISDDHFFFDGGYMKELGRAIVDARLGKKFFIQSRTDVMAEHPDMIDIWKEAGLNTVFIGFDGHTKERLRAIRKSAMPNDNELAVQVLQERGVQIMGNLIVDPNFTREDFANVRGYIRANNLGFLTYCITTPFPGTDVWNTRRAEVSTLDFSLYDLAHAVLKTSLPLEEFYAEYVSLWQLRQELQPPLSVVDKAKMIARAAANNGGSLELLRRAEHFTTAYAKIENYTADHRGSSKNSFVHWENQRTA
ncbi:MAG: B12-binding domain-containing radical SAM protein [Deltaproteobacteria bacterium]